MSKYQRLLVIVTVLFLSTGCYFNQQTQAQQESGQLSQSKDFKLFDLSRKLYTLSEYRDKQPVLLFFWTTWCPFCRRELKQIDQRYAELLRNKLQILSVNVGEPTAAVNNFFKGKAFLFPILLDQDAEVARNFGVLGVPTYILLDKAGNQVQRDNSFPQNYQKLLEKQK